MVKKLDLLESNHGLRAERTIHGKAFQNGRNTTLHGPHLTRNVFPKRFGAWRTSPMVSARFEYFDLTGKLVPKENWLRQRKRALCYPALSRPLAWADLPAVIQNVTSYPQIPPKRQRFKRSA